MLIGIDASRYGHETATGVERYSFFIINGLIKKISDLGEAGTAGNKHKLILYSQNELKFPKNFRYDENRVKFKVIPRKRFWTQIGLAKEMKINPPDRLFIPSHTLPLHFPKKTVVTIHDVAFRHLKKSYSLFQYLYLDWSTRHAVKNAWQIIVPSECTKNDLIDFYKCPPEKIHVVYHGYTHLPELSATPLQEERILKQCFLTPETKFIFFIGRLESKKNIENVLRAFAIFLKKHKDWKLFLGGKRGTGFKNILKTANELKLWEKVIMPGYVNDSERAILFKYCQFFAFPSLYEGFGFPILEAFSYGKPVLASERAAIPEIAGDASYYTDAFDHRKIADDFAKLASNVKLQDKLVAKGKERLLKFTWEDAVQKTFSILTK